MTAITVDRLLALLLRLRYRQTVTLKRKSIILAANWGLSGAGALCTLINHQAQVQVHVQLQSSQPNSPNISRYRKAVYSAL